MELVYEIDADDRLVGHNLGWDEFARANGAPDLADTVEPIVLWDSISDDTTRMLWSALIDHVRRTGEPLDVKYRCDAPHARRWFVTRLIPSPDRRVRFVARLVREEPRTPVFDESFAVDPDRFIRMCSWCGRFSCGEVWCGIEEAAEREGWLEERRQPSVTHGICPSCFDQQMAELEADDPKTAAADTAAADRVG